MTVPKADGRLLVREILRQAILLAARDELSLATRDMTLRETLVTGSTGVAGTLSVQTADSSGDFVRLQIMRIAGGRPKVVFEKEIPLPPTANGAFDYVRLVTAAEEMSRTELVDVLKSLGFDGRPVPSTETAAVDATTENLLGELNFISQFAALRRLHAIERKEGKSRASLAALRDATRIWAN